MKTFIVRSNDDNRLFIIASDNIEMALNQLKEKVINLPCVLNHKELGNNDIIDISVTYLYDDDGYFDVTWLSNDNIYVGLKFKYFHPQYGLQEWIVDEWSLNDSDKWCVKSRCGQFSFEAPIELIKHCLK
jgi:hypothetical protein